jgi:CrcB protein
MMKTLVRLLAVGGAGFVGAVARWGIGVWFGRLFEVRFPIATLVINVTGSFFLGWFITFIDRRADHEMLRLAIGVGFVGAYTTFSTYMFDTNRLVEDGAFYLAWVNLIGSIVLGLVAVRLGVMLGKS